MTLATHIFLAGFAVAQIAAASDWPSYGGSPSSTKFSNAQQINASNLDSVRIIWHWRPLDASIIEANPGVFSSRYRSTPLVIDGVLYASSPLNVITALDAATGDVLWNFDPKAWQTRGWYPSMHRGVAYWEEEARKRVVFGTGGGYLYSIDADSGLPDPAFGIGGRIDLATGLRRPIDRDKYAIISPPVVAGDVLVVGSSIADVRDSPVPHDLPPGDVRGIDKWTGKQLWVFETIPQPGQVGNDTWTDSSWYHFGATNVWSTMSYDPVAGYVYLPVSTPSNDFYGGERPGDNIFGDSIVCLEAASGDLVWHFQLVHHGLWDYDPPAASLLVDIEVDGRAVPALVQVSKQGHIYVFNRLTGEPVWPVVEMPAPASMVAGERTAPTQPHPSWPLPVDRQGLDIDDLIDFSPDLRRQAMELVSAYRSGPLYTPPSENGTILMPGLVGGADWAGAAIDPVTGILCVPSRTLPSLVTLEPSRNENSPSKFKASVQEGLALPNGLPLTKPPYGRVSAIDLNSGQHLWMRPMGSGPINHPALDGLAHAESLGWAVRTFTFVTPGLLFTASGDPRQTQGLRIGDNYTVDPESSIRVWELHSGSKLGEIALPSNAVAGPITYETDDRQFIVVPMGDGATRPTELVALSIPRPLEQLPPQVDKRYDAEHDSFYYALEMLDSGNIAELKELLVRHPSLSTARGFQYEFCPVPDLGNSTLLHLLIDTKRLGRIPPDYYSSAKALLRSGADPNALTRNGLSATNLLLDSHLPLETPDRDSTFVLLMRHGADPDRGGGRLLWDSIVEGNTDHAELLIHHGATMDLKSSAALGSQEMLATFFDSEGRLNPGSDNPYRPQGDRVRTEQELIDEAFHFAVYGGHRETTEFLLAKGARINSIIGFWWEWDSGSTALHKAAYADHADMLNFLFGRGADPSIPDKGWGETVAGWASYTESEELKQAANAIETAHRLNK